MGKKILYIIISTIVFAGLYVFANTTFDIDEAFFTETGISSGDYSAVHFGFSGNSSDAIIFWGENGNKTGEIILSGITINCNKQIEGMYINTVRGNTVWPLDQNTLNELSGSSNFSGYDNLTITGGFFTECTGTGINSNEIYGYIEHEYNNQTYKLWAGLDFGNITGDPSGIFSGSLRLITGTNITAEGYLLDNYGGTATVYSNITLNANINWTGSNTVISGGNYYTRYTGLQVNIWSSENGNFELSGDLVNIVTGTILTGEYSDKNIEITNIQGTKNINFGVSNSSGSFNKSISIVYDNEAPELSFTDGVNPNANTSDTIIVNFGDAAIKRYKIISNSGDCNTTITGTNEYTGNVTITSTAYNGDYFCAYAEDFLGNTSTIVSDSTFNIDNSQPSVIITDNFGITPVKTGTISITGSNITGNIMFKYVTSIVDCTNTSGVIYTGAFTVTNENLNGQYICAYANGNVNDVFATGVSHQINLDNTDPYLTQITNIPNYINTSSLAYTFSSNEAGSISYQGSCNGNNTTAISGNNNTTFSLLAEGPHTDCVISVTDSAGNTGSLNVSSFIVDTIDPVISGANHGTSYTGVVVITFSDTNLSGATVNGNTFVDGASFSNTGTYIIVVNDLAGNSSTITFHIVETVISDTTAPTLIQVTPVATYTNDNTPNYIFSSNEPGVISYIGDCSSSTTSASSGNNPITFNSLNEGLHNNCVISVTDSAGNTGSLNVSNFTVDTIDPQVNGVINGASYTGSVTITFSDSNLSLATIDGTSVNNGIVYSNTGIHTLIVTDLAGNNTIVNFTITANIVLDTTDPTVSLISPANGSTTTGTTNTFSWTGSDNVGISSYNLYISGTTMYTNIGATSPVTTTLASGTYTWYVIATDTSGNTGQSLSRTFVMANSTTPDTTDPIVELISPTSGSVITQNSITLQWSGSDNVAIDHYNIYIDGNTDYTLLNVVSNSGIINNIVNGNYSWYVIATDVNGNTGQSISKTFVISGSINSIPTLISPISGSNVYIGNLGLTWSGYSNSGYVWQIAKDTGFSNIVSSGNSQNLTATVLNNPNFMTGLFYWRVVNSQTTSISNYRSVNILDLTGGVDIKSDNFDFDNESDANLSTIYESNKISIEGLSNNVYVQASLEENIGALFINDIMVGSSGWVKNGDEVYIELISSNDYDERVSAKLIVGTGENMVSDTFRVETKSAREAELSYAQKIQAMLLLDTLIDVYGDNTEKLAQFLITFKSVLEDKSDWLENEIDDLNDGDDDLEIFVSQKAGVDYMYDIVDEYLNDMDYEGHNVYIAPNGKEYIVEYRNDKLAYTSPNFMYNKYFPTRKDFTSHIDINNTGPYYGDKGGEKIMAPNEKIYYIVQKNGKWTSTTFKYSKYFDTREQLIDYIFANNPGETWDHEIDTDFDEIDYTAPNGKKYIIFKTSDEGNNPDMYSSYKFVTPKYFPTVQRVKDHILNENK